MNEVLAPVWDEQVSRLRLGVEPQDALGRSGILAGLGLFIENVPRPHPIPVDTRAVPELGGVDHSIGLPGVRRSPSGRFAIAFGGRGSSAGTRVDLRIIDPSRRFVPRRLSVPVSTLAAVLAADQAHNDDPTMPLVPRGCRPALFPGAGHGVLAGATVIRGRATWGAGGPPAQWARIEARAGGASQPRPWRAQGDDRGEFVLVIGALSLVLALRKVLNVSLDIVVRARPLPPADTPVDSPAQSRRDPLWHLPIEQVATLDQADPVAAGAVLPAGYTSSAAQTVTCRRGGVTLPLPFVLN
jgi:hypothetical protein